jgi:hypothetical protein
MATTKRTRRQKLKLIKQNLLAQWREANLLSDDMENEDAYALWSNKIMQPIKMAIDHIEHIERAMEKRLRQKGFTKPDDHFGGLI